MYLGYFQWYVYDTYTHPMKTPRAAGRSGAGGTMRVLLVSPRPEGLLPFNQALQQSVNVAFQYADCGRTALAAIKTQAPDLAVIDSALQDLTARELLVAILHENAMVNTAVISPLAEEVFHTRFEGLGVLMRLSDPPLADEALTLARKARAEAA